MSNSDPTTTWEKAALEKLLSSLVIEQRRRRRWGIFFKLIFLAYIILFTIALWPSNDSVTEGISSAHIALLNIDGMIAPSTKNNADDINKNLTQAFEDKGTKAVILEINSPGGTPVQAADVYDRIKYLRSKHPAIKVYAACMDLCASGAYYIASAADDIYANQSSLIGSIGVLMNGFGVVDAMHKIGIERRLITAGSNKGMLDPFSPADPQQTQYAHQMIEQVHQVFIQAVKQGRGSRLKNDPTLFTGLVWTGIDALKLGLIDGYKSPQQIADDIVHVKKIVNYTTRPSIFERISGNFGTSFANAVFNRFIGPAIIG